MKLVSLYKKSFSKISSDYTKVKKNETQRGNTPKTSKKSLSIFKN